MIFICNNAKNARLSPENATIMPFFYYIFKNAIKMPKCHFNAKGLNNAKIAQNGIIKCQLATLVTNPAVQHDSVFYGGNALVL